MREFCIEQGIQFFDDSETMEDFFNYYEKHSVNCHPESEKNLFHITKHNNPEIILYNILADKFPPECIPKDINHLLHSQFHFWKRIRLSWYHRFNIDYFGLLFKSDFKIREWILYSEYCLHEKQQTKTFKVNFNSDSFTVFFLVLFLISIIFRSHLKFIRVSKKN